MYTKTLTLWADLMTSDEDSIQKMIGKEFLLMFSKQVCGIRDKRHMLNTDTESCSSARVMYLNHVSQAFLFSMLALINILLCYLFLLRWGKLFKVKQNKMRQDYKVINFSPHKEKSDLKLMSFSYLFDHI